MAVLDVVLAPPAVGAAVAAVLHVRGSRRHVRVVAPARRAAHRRRAWAFYAALVTIVVALDSPIDTAAGRLFWVHMVQHVLLMMVAAPLLVLAAPWTPMWKGLSPGARRSLAVGWVHSPAGRRLSRAARWLGAPACAWLLFNGDLLAWHVPALYDLTLRHQAIHDAEHVTFLVLAVVFWAQVLPSPPLRPKLDLARRIAYVTGAAAVAWLLALILAFARSPLYAAYAERPRAGGLSALTDQQLAAGIMWGPGSIPYAIFVFAAVYAWLAGQNASGARPKARPALKLP